ncbi:hypothetical protein D3C83_311050 [compost metagenome]
MFQRIVENHGQQRDLLVNRRGRQTLLRELHFEILARLGDLVIASAFRPLLSQISKP